MSKSPFASRMNRLGTETAYAVSDAAKKYAKETGKKVYPFHLGDMNINTADNIINAATEAMKAGKTGYCSAAGIQELKEALAEDINRSHGTSYTAENISIQSGGKPVIGKFIMTLMEEGSEVLYPTPGYPIYESQIEFFNGIPKAYRYVEHNSNGKKISKINTKSDSIVPPAVGLPKPGEGRIRGLGGTKGGFAMDMDYFKSQLSEKTSCLIYNNYQNPMGVASSNEEMAEIAKLAVENNLMVLADEAYFDLVFEGEPRSIVSHPGMEERTVLLYTFSKRFAMTGWRLGAAIGPKHIIDQINKINTNDEACTTHFVQIAGIEALTGPQEHQKMIKQTLIRRLNVIMEELKDCPGIIAHKPKSTFYLFVNVTKAMEKMGINKVEKFRQTILEKTGVSVTHREHFGKPMPNETQHYIRFAYSGINEPEIKEGLRKFKKFISTFF